jgi:hypothetical protein
MKRHQKEFEQYLEDWKRHDKPWELWEVNRRLGTDERWLGWLPMDDTDSCYFGFETWDFRRKPETIKVGDCDLPKPITEMPKDGEIVYVFAPDIMGGYTSVYYNINGDGTHFVLFDNGFIFQEESHVKQWVKWWREVVLSQLG